MQNAGHFGNFIRRSHPNGNRGNFRPTPRQATQPLQEEPVDDGAQFPPSDDEPVGNLIEEAAERLATDENVMPVAAELVDAEIRAARLLIAANLEQLNAMLGNGRQVTQGTPLVEILVAIQIRLAGRQRDSAARWLEMRRYGDGYRREAVWEALTWLTIMSEQLPAGDVVRQATGRAFLHDELVRNLLTPALKTFEHLESILRDGGEFFELAARRREDFLQQRSRYSSNGNGNRNGNSQDRRPRQKWQNRNNGRQQNRR